MRRARRNPETVRDAALQQRVAFELLMRGVGEHSRQKSVFGALLDSQYALRRVGLEIAEMPSEVDLMGSWGERVVPLVDRSGRIVPEQMRIAWSGSRPAGYDVRIRVE